MEIQDFIDKNSQSPEVECYNYAIYMKFLKLLESLGFYSHLPVELREEVLLSQWGRVFVHCRLGNRELTPGIVDFVQQHAPHLNNRHHLAYDVSLRAVYNTVAHLENGNCVSELFRLFRPVLKWQGVEFKGVGIRPLKGTQGYEVLIDYNATKFEIDLEFKEGWYASFPKVSHCLHAFNTWLSSRGYAEQVYFCMMGPRSFGDDIGIVVLTKDLAKVLQENRMVRPDCRPINIVVPASKEYHAPNLEGPVIQI